jgi:ABC-type multidrug transport system fused ATPase/permease subunit
VSIQSQAFKHCTVVTIAHRIQSVIDADMILVLSDGCLVEQGAPWQLVEDVSSTKCTSVNYTLLLSQLLPASTL